MIIQTERLLLRPLNLNDLYTTHQYVGDKENIKYMVYFPTENLEETKEFISKAVNEWQSTLPQFYEFAVVFENKHIGSVSIYLDEKRTEAELAWIGLLKRIIGAKDMLQRRQKLLNILQLMG